MILWPWPYGFMGIGAKRGTGVVVVVVIVDFGSWMEGLTGNFLNCYDH